MKKSPLNAFAQVRRNGLRAMALEEGDELLDVKHCRAGRRRDPGHRTRPLGALQRRLLRKASRISGGVRGIKLANGDQLASMDVVVPEAQLLVVTRNGLANARRSARSRQRVAASAACAPSRPPPRPGPVAAARVVHGDEELMMISANGIVIRMAIETISERTGRSTGGVMLMRLDDGDTWPRSRSSSRARTATAMAHDEDVDDGTAESGASARVVPGEGEAHSAWYAEADETDEDEEEEEDDESDDEDETADDDGGARPTSDDVHP